jgi:hypothetical protein
MKCHVKNSNSWTIVANYNKMENYIVKSTHCRYYNKPCLILFSNCTLIACDNYITIHHKLTKLQVYTNSMGNMIFIGSYKNCMNFMLWLIWTIYLYIFKYFKYSNKWDIVLNDLCECSCS